jgi:anti-anti-sigma regulatory factor
MKTSKQVTVVVKAFPSVCGQREGREFLRKLSASLQAVYEPRVILDLSESTLEGATDIEVLLQCIDLAVAGDGEVALAAPSRRSRLILELTRIDRVAQIFDSLEEAKSHTRLGPGLTKMPELPLEEEITWAA